MGTSRGCCNSVDHMQSSEVEGLRTESGGLWPLQRHDTLSHQPSGVEPIMPHQKGWTLSGLCVSVPKISPGAGEFYNRASWVREDTGMMESTISPPQCLLLIILLPCLAQTPACSKTKVDLSWSSSGDHPLCTWSALLHTVSKAPAGFANGWLSY